MGLSRATVEHIASLARLSLDEKELSYFTGQLESILGYIDQLKEVDTHQTPETSHPLSLRNVFRADTVAGSLPRAQVLANAPEAQNGNFSVSRIIEE